MKFLNIKITKYLHSGFRIDWPGDQKFQLSEMFNEKFEQIIYIDPFKIPDDQPKADIIFISHEHFDHCDPDSIEKILKPETVVIGNIKVEAALKKLSITHFETASVSTQKGVNGLIYTCLPAYNIDKFREKNMPFHPKENGGLGFLLKFNIHNERELVFIYHMGDSDFDKEVMTPSKVDILLIPISGTYVMTVEEAIEAVNTINPKIAIPMHYDAGVAGELSDGEKFKTILGNKAEILKAESN